MFDILKTLFTLLKGSCLMKKIICCLLFLLISFSLLNAHCQIPCGIYDDNRVFSELKEHAATIRKSINSINTLAEEMSNQQFVRWVNNKETHASNIQHIMLDYFLAQRIKQPQSKKERKKHLNLLESAHSIIVKAMKAKQNASMTYSNELEESIDDFQTLYLAK